MSNSSKPRLYLAGAIQGMADLLCRKWRQEATKALGDYFEVLDPMRHDWRGREWENIEALVEGDLHDVRRAHVVLVDARQGGWGTPMEVHEAFNRGKHVVLWGAGDFLSPWAIYHSHEIYATLDAAIAACQKWAEEWQKARVAA